MSAAPRAISDGKGGTPEELRAEESVATGVSNFAPPKLHFSVEVRHDRLLRRYGEILPRVVKVLVQKCNQHLGLALAHACYWPNAKGLKSLPRSATCPAQVVERRGRLPT